MNRPFSRFRTTSPAPRRRRGGAFTVVELLVAVGITAVLAAFMVVILANVSGFWARTSGRVSADSQARFILDRLTVDLESAVFRDDGGAWMAVNVLANTSNSGLWDTRGATSGALKPTSAVGTTLSYTATNLADTTHGQAGTWLRFFTTKRGTNATVDTLSAPVAVGWQIIRRASSASATSTDRRYFLHRAEVTPQRTLETGFSLTASAYNGSSSGNTGGVGQSYSLKSPADTGAIIGENVIDFGVRLYSRTSPSNSALTRIYPQTTQTSHVAQTPPGVGAVTGQFPDVIEVMVRILTDEGARQIAAFEASPQRLARPSGVPTDAQYWWQLALANSQVYTRRIVVSARPF